jgi:hypothetical protein
VAPAAVARDVEEDIEAIVRELNLTTVRGPPAVEGSPRWTSSETRRSV